MFGPLSLARGSDSHILVYSKNQGQFPGIVANQIESFLAQGLLNSIYIQIHHLFARSPGTTWITLRQFQSFLDGVSFLLIQIFAGFPFHEEIIGVETYRFDWASAFNPPLRTPSKKGS